MVVYYHVHKCPSLNLMLDHMTPVLIPTPCVFNGHVNVLSSFVKLIDSLYEYCVLYCALL
jgi:hypothetical protein